MTKTKLIGIVAAAILVAFLIGFLPQWLQARNQRLEMEAARQEWQAERTSLQHELEIARLEGRLGAALAESLRGNYERSRQLMVSFYTDLENTLPAITDAEQRREIEALLQQRFEIVTLLSRAEPEATERLMLMYTRFFAAMDPAGQEAPTSLTPSPPAEIG